MYKLQREINEYNDSSLMVYESIIVKNVLIAVKQTFYIEKSEKAMGTTNGIDIHSLHFLPFTEHWS